MLHKCNRVCCENVEGDILSKASRFPCKERVIFAYEMESTETKSNRQTPSKYDIIVSNINSFAYCKPPADANGRRG